MHIKFLLSSLCQYIKDILLSIFSEKIQKLNLNAPLLSTELITNNFLISFTLFKIPLVFQVYCAAKVGSDKHFSVLRTRAIMYNQIEFGTLWLYLCKNLNCQKIDRTKFFIQLQIFLNNYPFTFFIFIYYRETTPIIVYNT